MDDYTKPIEIEDESWTMGGTDAGSVYNVAFETRTFRVGVRMAGAGAFKNAKTGEAVDAYRVRVQVRKGASFAFNEDTAMPGPYLPKSHTHASCIVPAPCLGAAVAMALVWALTHGPDDMLHAGAPKALAALGTAFGSN